MLRTLPFVAIAFLMDVARLPAGEPPTAQILETPSGVRFGIWPQKPDKPAPTLFIFAGGLEDALNSEYFRQSGNQLANQGYLCVSVDLPCHGKEVRGGEPMGIDGWRYRGEAGEDFVAAATNRFSQVLDDLIETKLTDPDKVAACGTSRGGYMAVQFAAADSRVKAAAAFAPVTDLLLVREFASTKKKDFFEKLSLHNQAEKLAGRAVWLVIGDRDDRVSTDAAIKFCRAVTAASLKQQKPALVDLLVISEPQGHTTPKGAPEGAAKWIAEQLQTTK